MKKFIFVVSGPSGVGKTSVVNELLKVRNNVSQVVSYTTRERRSNEINGVHYHFINNEQFNDLDAKGDFLESAEIFNYKYGVSKSAIKSILEAKHALLVISWSGFSALKEVFKKQVIGIFISPPSLQILRERIEHRSTDSAEEIARRLKMADEDMAHRKLYDYDIVNEDIQSSVFQIAKILDLAK